MERQPYGIDGDFKSRRIPCRNTKGLGTGDKVNERSLKEHEKTIQQEKVESLRIKGWR